MYQLNWVQNIILLGAKLHVYVHDWELYHLVFIGVK